MYQWAGNHYTEPQKSTAPRCGLFVDTDRKYYEKAMLKKSGKLLRHSNLATWFSKFDTWSLRPGLGVDDFVLKAARYVAYPLEVASLDNDEAIFAINRETLKKT